MHTGKRIVFSILAVMFVLGIGMNSVFSDVFSGNQNVMNVMPEGNPAEAPIYNDYRNITEGDLVYMLPYSIYDSEAPRDIVKEFLGDIAFRLGTMNEANDASVNDQHLQAINSFIADLENANRVNVSINLYPLNTLNIQVTAELENGTFQILNMKMKIAEKVKVAEIIKDLKESGGRLVNSRLAEHYRLSPSLGQRIAWFLQTGKVTLEDVIYGFKTTDVGGGTLAVPK